MSDPIPSAVARGPDAATPGAISPVRAGIVAGLLAAVLVFAAFLVAPVPDRALKLVGADGDDFARYGGMRIVWVPPADADVAKVEDTFATRHEGARISRDGDALVVEVGGVPPEEVARAAKLLSAGGLAFHRAVIAPEMPELARTYGVPIPEGEWVPTQVAMSSDHWTPEDGGARRTDFYLYGPTREAIEATIVAAQKQGWRLPDGTRIAYEHVDGWDGRPDFWRSYVIETEPALGGEHVASAIGSYDPNTNRPIVLLDFTREGAEIFGHVTAAMVGQKLATLLGGDVVSAPIINSAIRGGRASIAMGGSEVQKQERERDALVGVLRAGQLPAGGTLREASYIAPSVTSLQEWLARLLLALGAGVIVGLLAWAFVRSTHPVWRTPDVRLPGSIPWARLGVMLLVPMVVIVASFITAPGIDPDQLAFTGIDESGFSIGMLGVGPLLSSFLLVELVATIVPRLRRRRHAGPKARLPFDVATLATAVVLSLLQSWFIAVFLGPTDAAPLGLDRLLFLTSMAGMTLGFAFLAWLVRVYGIGNGYAAILVTSFVWAIVQRVIDEPVVTMFSSPPIETSQYLIAGVAMLVPALAIAAVLRMRISRAGEVPLRVPASGVAPIGEAEGMLALIFAALGMIPIGALSETMYDAQIWLHELHRVAALAIVIAFAVLWSWAFARPKALAPFAERAGLAGPSRESWRSATILTAGVLVVLAAGYAVLGTYTASGMMGTFTGVMFGAFVLDAYDDLRGRRGRLAFVWALQSAQHADIAAEVLARENVAFHMTGANLRTLFAWFGPFAPIDVWVRREDTQRARELLANVFAPK